MKKFAERYDVRGLEGSSKMLDVLAARATTNFVGGKADRKPVIAIVDLQGSADAKGI